MGSRVTMAIESENSYVPLEVAEGIPEQFFELCERRKVDPGVMFTTMLRAFDRRAVSYNQYDRLDFGKYKGLVVGDVIATDPRYMRWLVSTSEWFKLTGPALELLQNVEV